MKERSAIKFFNSLGVQIVEISLSDPAIKAYNKGIGLFKQGNTEKAIASFKEAIRMEPNYIDAHYNLAASYYFLEQMEDARKEYEKVLELRPQDVDALNNLGAITFLDGQLEQAKQLFDKAFKFDSEFALTHRNFAVYYQRKGNATKSAEHVKKAKEFDEKIFDQESRPPRIPAEINF